MLFKIVKALLLFILAATTVAINYGHKILGWLGVGGASDDWGTVSGWIVSFWLWLGLPPVTQELIFNAIAICAVAAIFWVFLGDAIKVGLVKATGIGATLKIEFDNNSNLESKFSPYKDSTTLLVNAQPLGEHVTRHEFRIGLLNASSRTIRRCGLTITRINMPDRSVNYACKSLLTNMAEVDISPGKEELFIFCVGHDRSREGLGNPVVVNSTGQYLEWLDTIKQRGSTTVLAWHNGPVAILENDGYLLDVVAYADDIKPIHSKFRIDNKNRLTVTKIS